MSSKPIKETSSGTRMPRRCNARARAHRALVVGREDGGEVLAAVEQPGHGEDAAGLEEVALEDDARIDEQRSYSLCARTKPA